MSYAPEAPMQSPLSERRVQPHTTEEIGHFMRARLGVEEPAICAQISLSSGPSDDHRVDLVLLDVGFKGSNGEFGPYDLEGSGEKRTFKKQYVLMSRRIDEGTQASEPAYRYFEFDPDVPVSLGRHSTAALSLGFSDNPYVSRKHAKLTVRKTDGLVGVEDEGSTNGTSLINTARILEPSDTEFSYTHDIADYVSAVGKGHHLVPKEVESGWGHGMYAGRPVIGRDTPINGGVYPVGGKHGEALVIDDKRYPDRLNDVYGQVVDEIESVDQSGKFATGAVRKLVGRDQTVREAEVEEKLSAVFGVVLRTLRYDLEATNAIARDYEKVAINSYIAKGVGVCRTQAALSAYALERLIHEGKLEGRVSIDRNIDHNVAGGHAWARYTDPTGQVFIIDPAQKFVGTLKEANRNPQGWDYRRTEDLVKQLLEKEAHPTVENGIIDYVPGVTPR